MSCEHLNPSVCGKRNRPTITNHPCVGIRITGIGNVTVNQGVGIDLVEGVHAYDSNGEEIAFTVSPQTIDACSVGTHIVTYTATGADSSTLPNICGENALKIKDCGLVTKTANRRITITQADNPVISGLEPLEVSTGEVFDPTESVSAVDDNGNPLTVSVELLPEE